MPSVLPKLGILPGLHVDLITVIRCGFFGASFLIVLIHNTPVLARRILHYGARSLPSNPSVPVQDALRNDRDSPRNASLHPYLDAFLDVLEPLRVPHSWFKHFYLLSVLSSLFWAYQIWARASAYRLIADYVSDYRYPTMKIDQLVVLWLVMLIQGSRRLYEAFAYAKPSRSTMWIGHWLMGLGFYLFINIAIWIEGVATLRLYDDTHDPKYLHSSNAFRLMAIVELLGIARYSYSQNRLHHYLATLPAAPHYEVPKKYAFTTVICPHYGEEVLIYYGLYFLGGYPAPNLTLLMAYIFVYLNLNITARGTREWSKEKFGDEAVKAKSLMLTKAFGESLLEPFGLSLMYKPTQYVLRQIIGG